MINEEEFKEEMRQKLAQDEELKAMAEEIRKDKDLDDEPTGPLLKGDKILDEHWDMDDE